ncbi:IS200/IS605 family transposase [Bernardetia sp.]|uniref:IS200/IS605 family transposase n=1 Tax=Bernardetia sp. TaxID=1937974 RepID=UPI0025BF9453|nr:IS200/IS605 family transposase [Bernardetia sp.]
MPNTYSQIYIQFVFAVKGRQSLIQNSFKDELEKYICGIVNGKNQKPLAVYCMPDHIHLLVGLSPNMSVSDLVRDVKNNSSKFINQEDFTKIKFKWQEGYGAFSYSKSQLDRVINYILNQKEHHRKKTFKEEYIDFLQKFEVEYDEKYLFDWIE